MSSVRALLDAGTTRLGAVGVPTPRLDAELLLAHVLGVTRTGVLAHPDAPVGTGPEASFQTLLARREAGQPVAYLRGVREFHGLAIAVDERVLIPRPETELLVDLAFEWLRARLTGAPRPPGAPPLRVWDVGTGSGAIAVALAAALRRRGFLDEAHITASDISPDALAAAMENVVAHGLADHVRLVQGDLLDVPDAPGTDLLLANLPYVPSEVIPTLAPEVRAEPRLALDGGIDGLDLIRRLIGGLPGALAPGGVALLEIGTDQSTAVLDVVAGGPGSWSVAFHEDLAGRPRVAELRRAGERPTLQARSA